MKNANKNWWDEGVRFECQGSGKCCVSHGEYGFVFLTRKDRMRMAKHLGLSLSEFTKKHCDQQGSAFHLKEDPQDLNCRFLNGKQCGIYEARPIQCRTWPFWPEVMNTKTWKKEVAAFCPGVGKGRVWPKSEIKQLLKEQKESEKEIWSDS